MEGIDLLAQIFVRQRAFQERLDMYIDKPFEYAPGNIKQMWLTGPALEIVKINGDALMMEGAEIKDWTPWKHWSKQIGNKSIPIEAIGSPQHVEEMRIEVADAMCFLTNIAMALGMDAKMLNDYHEKKMGTNHDRQDSGVY